MCLPLAVQIAKKQSVSSIMISDVLVASVIFSSSFKTPIWHLLPFDERKQIVDKMIVIATMKSEKDSEGKKFIFSVLTLGATVITITVTTLSAALGGNFKINTDSIKRLAK